MAKKPKKKAERKLYRDAATGQFTSKANVARNKKGTVVESLKPKKRPAKKK